MKKALLATVAVAALAIGGAMVNAQERGSSTAPASQPGAMQSDGMTGGAEKPDKAAPARATQQGGSNRGAGQTGQQRAQDSSSPTNDAGKARAEDRRPAQNDRMGSSAERDKSRSQAQQEKTPASRNSAAESDQTHRQADKAQPKSDRTGAADNDASRNHAQQDKAPANRNSAAQNNRDAPRSQAQQNGGMQPDRTGANEQRKSTSSAGRAASERHSDGDVNVTGSIRVDNQKASRVHDELIRTAPKSNVNISVSVGERLPPTVRARRLPASIISISPEFRGYDYVVVQDEIVIVEPKTRKVVTVIRGGGGPSHRAQRASFSLDAQQRSRIRSDIRIEQSRSFDDIEVSEGRMVPQTVVLEPLPDVIVRDVPQVRDYRYFVDDRRIVIVDPDTREVVDIIQ